MAMSSDSGSTPLASTKTKYADVAQLAEHFTRNEGVGGSNPSVSTTKNVDTARFTDFKEPRFYHAKNRSGTLYPILHHMKEDRLLGKGKIRKYYSTTEKGNAVLDEARKKHTTC